MAISFIGYSDDIVHVNFRPDYGDNAYRYIDEYCVYGETMLFVLEHPEHDPMFVSAHFMSQGVWSFMPMQWSKERNNMFHCVLVKGHEYSTRLHIACPDGTRVTRV